MTKPLRRTRHLDWEGCYNIRDLGGIPTADGQLTCWRSLIRADDLTHLTPMGWESVYRYGVRTLIDLRAPHESYTTPISTCLPPSLQGSLAYLNLPLEQHPPPPHILARLERAADRAETYAVLLTSYQPTVVMILRAIMLADPGGVIIFCRMGKDRTGMIAALLSGLSLTSF